MNVMVCKKQKSEKDKTGHKQQIKHHQIEDKAI